MANGECPQRLIAAELFLYPVRRERAELRLDVPKLRLE